MRRLNEPRAVAFDRPLVDRGRLPPERRIVITSVLDPAAAAQVSSVPATVRLGLLGLGTVGGAVARLARERGPEFAEAGITPIITAALVRDPARHRHSARFVEQITGDADAVLHAPIDVLVEALGGVEPAFTLVRRALDRGMPVVTANKSLVAAKGAELTALARQRGTAFRYEASCIAGVPFLGTFERRPLAARVSGLTAILNGTSNWILSAMTAGASFEAALAEAQRQGLAEPDPAMDVSGADSAEKLTVLLRIFGQRLVAPQDVPLSGIETVRAADFAAAAAFDGTIKPVAHAAWQATGTRDVAGFIGPAFVPSSHPLARVQGVTNGIILEAAGGQQCYTGPGAGPDVTAATLLDDVIEIIREGRPQPPAARPLTAAAVTGPTTGWFVRAASVVSETDLAELLGSYGLWTSRLTRRAEYTYALTSLGSPARVQAALTAITGATREAATALRALTETSAC